MWWLSGAGVGVGEIGDCGQRVHTSSCKTESPGDVMYVMATVVNNTLLYS